MSETSGGSDSSYLPGAGKKASPNVSSGWIVMVLSGLIAMVVFIYATQQGGTRYSVAVPVERIDPGERVNPAMFREIEVNVPEAQLNRLLRFSDLSQIDGSIAAAGLEPGDLVPRSLLMQGTVDQLHAMSIPVSRERAVDGALRTGDRVDIVNRYQDRSYIVAYDLEVVSVNAGGGGGGLGAGQNFNVTVALTPQEAVAVNFAINEGRHDVVKSTGAPVPVSPEAITNAGQPVGATP